MKEKLNVWLAGQHLIEVAETAMTTLQPWKTLYPINKPVPWKTFFYCDGSCVFGSSDGKKKQLSFDWYGTGWLLKLTDKQTDKQAD